MKKLGYLLGVVSLLLASSYVLQPSQAWAGEHAKEGETAKAASVSPIFVDMAPLALPVMTGNTIDQIVQITITIEVPDQEKADKIKQVKPRLADAYVQNLYGAIERKAVLNGGLVDISRLRDAITRASIGVLGENSFSKILIQKVAQHALQG